MIERLVAQVPRPRAHLARYHGVLAPAFAARPQIALGHADAQRDVKAGAVAQPEDGAGANKRRRPTRYPWASLIWRVFLKDILECARCAGRMEIVAAVTPRAGIVRILEHLRLPTTAPAVPPTPLPQSELSFDVTGFEPDLDGLKLVAESRETLGWFVRRARLQLHG